jgi:hypothetical protein
LSETEENVNSTNLLRSDQKKTRISKDIPNQEKFTKVRKTLVLLKNTFRIRKRKQNTKLGSTNGYSKSKSKEKAVSLEEINRKFTFEADEVIFQTLTMTASKIGRVTSAFDLELDSTTNLDCE